MVGFKGGVRLRCLPIDGGGRLLLEPLLPLDTLKHIMTLLTNTFFVYYEFLQQSGRLSFVLACAQS